MEPSLSPRYRNAIAEIISARVTAARAGEREACAKVADEYDAKMMDLLEKANPKETALTAMALAAGDIATAIREREI